jgi:hypothetical protein
MSSIITAESKEGARGLVSRRRRRRANVDDDTVRTVVSD